MQDTRIALIVSNARIGQTETNYEKTADWVERGARAGANLVCFPELNLTGYHIRPPLAEVAEPGDSSYLGRLEKLARTHQVTILAGMAERAPGGRAYAAHGVIGPHGIAGKYRKTHLGPPEKEVFVPGDEPPPLFQTDRLNFGIQLCYDAHFPELSTHMALAGADAVFIPHASPGASPSAKLASWMRHLPARAFDNSVFVIALNQTGGNGCGLSFPGAALVLSPAGTVLASYAHAAEQMLLVDLKASELASVRQQRMRCFLPHRRPELYRKLFE